MAERKSLVEGLKTASTVGPSREKAFVYGDPPKATPAETAVAHDVPAAKAQTGRSPSRVPLTTRIRSDFAAALKRASLERQLNGVHPNTLQDILEDALEPWLQRNGYLTPPHP
jgi:cell pole-organizing protein PopZ